MNDAVARPIKLWTSALGHGPALLLTRRAVAVGYQAVSADRARHA